jgi:hypothetical protein
VVSVVADVSFRRMRSFCWLLAVAMTASGCDASKGGGGEASSKEDDAKKKPKGSADAKQKGEKGDAKEAKDDAKKDEAPKWSADVTPKVEAIQCKATIVGTKLAPCSGRPQEMTHDPRSVFWSSEQGDNSVTVHVVNRDGADAKKLAKIDQPVVALAVWQDDVWVLGKKGDLGTLMRLPRAGGTPETRLQGAIGGLGVHRGAALVVRDAGDDLELLRVEPAGEPAPVARWRGEAQALAVVGDIAYVASAAGVSRIDLATKEVAPVALTVSGSAAPPVVHLRATASHLMVSFAQEGDAYKGGIAAIAGGALTPFDGSDTTLNGSAAFFVKSTRIGEMDWGPDQVMRLSIGEAKPKSIRSVSSGVGALSADDECVFVATGIPGSACEITAVGAGG